MNATSSHLLLWGGFLLCLGACTPYKSLQPSNELDLPSKWTQNSQNVALPSSNLSTWWKHFNDPILDQLIQSALQQSPDLRSTLSRVEEARARTQLQRIDLFPTLQAGMSAQTRGNHPRDASSNSNESWGATTDASWQLDLFGKKQWAIQAAEKDVLIAQENHYAAQATLIAELAEAYLQLRQNETLYAVAEESIRSRAETTQITAWREQAQTGTALDSLQAQTTLQQAQANLPSIRQNIEQSRNRISLLTGQSPHYWNQLLNTKKPLPEARQRIATGIPAEVLRQRPDIRAAERAIEAAFLRVRSVESDRLPTLNLSGSIGIDALKAGRLTRPENVATSLIAGLSAPVFDSGRISTNIAIQNQQVQQALHQYHSLVLTSLNEVENALITLQRSNERLQILNQATRNAKEAEVLAQQQYQAGQTNLLVVLEAQRTLLSLQEQQINIRATHSSALIQLYKALGGGWSAQ